MNNASNLLLAYIALIAVSHDGIDYAPGTSLPLTLQQAEPLLDAKAIELDRSNGGGDTTRAPELSEIDRLNEILASTKEQLATEQAGTQDLLGQLESAQTAKASAQSEVAELQVKLGETLDALLASQTAAKPGKKA